MQIFSLIFVFLQSYYGEPSIQQKILGLLVGSECVERSRLVSLLQLRGTDVSGSSSTFLHIFLQNNIAEVEDLQSDLLDEDLLEHILSLMQDAQVDMEVRYFAGGILAQLASRPQAWTLSEELLGAIVEQLVRVFMVVFEADSDSGHHL